MRLLAFLLALLLVPASAQAQSTEADVLVALLSGDEESDDNPFGNGATCEDPVVWALVGVAVAASALFACLIVTTNEPQDGDTIGDVVLVRSTDAGELALADGEAAATHALHVLHRPRRGIGLTAPLGLATVQGLHPVTGQPSALGPLGESVVTVRTSDDLRQLIHSFHP